MNTVRDGAGAICGASQAQPLRDTLDKVVRGAVESAPDDARVRVIVTVAPNAKPGLLAKLRAHGAQVTHDFEIINAVAAKLPVGLIRSLAHDRDVIAVSYDDDVTTSGLSTSVTGTAEGSRFTLRRTLGLDTASRVSAVNTTSANAAATSSVTFLHTVAAGQNRLLLVGASLFDGGASKQVTSVTFGSTALTKVGAVLSPGNQMRSELWALKAPAVGNNTTVRVTLNAKSDGVVVGATSFVGVNQSTLLAAAVTAAATSTVPAAPPSGRPARLRCR